jgi:2-dehydro-3-deoxyphosphogluconate aldolase/(4S)-4-hydroxy-2-oxoglutarate aldolase
MSNILAQLSQHKIVPVIALEDAAGAVPLARALMAGGLPVAEVTFRTAAAEASIKAMAGIPEMIVGAGTVLNVETVKRAVDAGARFIVSPGLNPKVVKYCVDQGIAITPGAVTPTEIEAAMDLGLSVVKFFPAEVYGGLKAIKALSAPYGMIKFIPTGGVNAANLAEFLSTKSVLACGGSWMVAKELLSGGKWDEVTRLTAEAVGIAKTVK